MSEGGETAPLIEKVIVLALFSALVFGVLMILKPFAVAILFGVILAVSSWPLREAVTRRGVAPAWTSAILLALSLLLVIAPVLVVAPTLASDVRSLFGAVQDELARGLTKPAWLVSLPVAGPWIDQNWERLFGSPEAMRSFVLPYSEWLRTSIAGLAASLADSLLQFVLALVVAAMLWVHGSADAAMLGDVLRRLGGKRFVEFSTIATNAICGSVYGVAGTAAAQAALMFVGLAAVGVPGALPLGFVTLILAVSQIGTILIHAVWIGAAWWLHQNGMADWKLWFIAVWGVVVTHIDGLLKPMLIGKRIQMPMTLVMLGVFGGFVSFGFLGLFIGPAILAVAWALMNEWRSPSQIDAMLHAGGEPDSPIPP